MDVPCELVPVVAADADSIASVQSRCFEAGWSSASVAGLLALNGTFGFMTLAEDMIHTPSGFVLARTVGDEAEILSLGVLTQYRRKGYARALLQRTLETARTRGATKIFLEVSTGNDGARALYAAAGFTEIGKRAAYYQSSRGAGDAVVCTRLL